jgi:hypothetical protein
MREVPYDMMTVMLIIPIDVKEASTGLVILIPTK